MMDAPKSQGGITPAFSVVLAMLPLLSMYSTPMQHVSLGDVAMALFAGLALSGLIAHGRRVWRHPAANQPLALLAAIALITAASMSIAVSGAFSLSDIVLRHLKLALWALTVSVTARCYLDSRIVLTSIRVVAVIASLALFVQYMAWNGFGVYVPLLVNSELLPLMGAQYGDSGYMLDYFHYFYYRPTSFFAEPAYFAYYALLALCIELATAANGWGKARVFRAILFALAIVTSTSTTGIYMLGVAGLSYLVVLGSRGRRVSRGPLLGLLGLTLSVLIGALFGSGAGNRGVQAALFKPSQWADSTRLGASFSLTDEMTDLQSMVGVGFGNEDVFFNLGSTFYNDVTMIHLSAGYIGLVAVSLLFIAMLARCAPLARPIVLICIVVMFGEQFLYSSFGVLYLCIAVYALSEGPHSEVSATPALGSVRLASGDRDRFRVSTTRGGASGERFARMAWRSRYQSRVLP